MWDGFMINERKQGCSGVFFTSYEENVQNRGKELLFEKSLIHRRGKKHYTSNLITEQYSPRPQASYLIFSVSISSLQETFRIVGVRL